VNIFRKVALDRLASPEQLDLLMQVTTPRGWIALAGLGLLLLAALAWGIFGSVATTVEGQGILVQPEGVKTIVAARPGVVARILVQVGDVIYKDREVVRLVPEPPGETPPGEPFIASTSAGRVLEILVKEGSPVDKGSVILILEPVGEVLQALIYVPMGKGLRVEPAMPVEVSPHGVKASEYGYLVGEVSSAAKFPSTNEGMMRNLENDVLVKSLLAQGPCLRITAELHRDPDAPSGYQWSSSHGPGLRLHTGTTCRALITVREQRPISLLIPLTREFLGY
jgi:Biotin-lipoyl like